MKDTQQNLEKQTKEEYSEADLNLYYTLTSPEAIYVYKQVCKELEQAKKEGNLPDVL